MHEIRTETKKDPDLVKLITQIQQGLTSNDKSMSIYKPHQTELSVVDGIIMKGTQIIIPKVMRANIRNILHEQGGHQGIVKTKLRA